MKFHQALFTASLFVGLTAGLGCSGTGPTGGEATGGTTTDEGKTIKSIEIKPIKQLHKGSSEQLRVEAHYTDGTSDDVTDSGDVVWSIPEATVATVSRGGMLSAVKAGSVNVTVEYKGKKGQQILVIMP